MYNVLTEMKRKRALKCTIYWLKQLAALRVNYKCTMMHYLMV